MKKAIALVIICLLAMMSLTACGSTSTTELNELRQQVNALETKVSELEKDASVSEEATTVSTNDPTEATESSTTSTVENMSEYLDNQVKSSDPVNWFEVANCDVATEKNLLEVAEKCASINYYYYTSDDKSAAVKLANALSENPNSTKTVMQELVNSAFPDVVSIGHQWIEKT